MNDSAIGWAVLAKGMQALRRLKGSKLSPVTDSDLQPRLPEEQHHYCLFLQTVQGRVR